MLSSFALAVPATSSVVVLFVHCKLELPQKAPLLLYWTYLLEPPGEVEDASTYAVVASLVLLSLADWVVAVVPSFSAVADPAVIDAVVMIVFRAS